KSLGVQVGGRTTPAAPFEHLRSSMANTDPDAFEGATEAATEGPGCPFAAMVNEGTAPARVPWTPEAETRVERIPEFIRPMARRKPRTLKNPRTGQSVTVGGRAPRFKPSKELKQAVR